MISAPGAPCLLAIEQDIEAQARQWQRQQLQARLQQVAVQQGAVCPLTGKPLEDARYETISLITCTGTVEIRAHYGRHPQTRQWMSPVRVLWGLAPRQKISPQLADRAVYTALETDAFARAAKMAAKWGTPIAASTIHKLVQQMGARAQTQNQAREEQLLDPARQTPALAPRPNGLAIFSLVIMMDGFMARERGPDWGLKPAEAPGSRVEWHEVKAGTIFRVDQVAEKASGRRLIVQKQWVLAPGRTPPQEFGRRVYAEAVRRGMGSARYVFVLADGAVWIWNVIEDRFAFALKGLDFYHASTHLWAIAHELFPEDAHARAWVEPLLHQLKHGQEEQVLATLEALPQSRPAGALGLSELLQGEIEYFQTHREHLHYQDLAAKGSPIGSGAMESTCGQLQTRVKRTGQFWKTAGLAHMLHLKAALQNDDWPSLWSSN
jgi:hypothetical protein